MVKIKYAILASGIFFLSLTFGASVSRADDWKPVDPAELQSKTPVVERDADAEAIFWEVRVQDEFDGGSVRTILWHYIRIRSTPIVDGNCTGTLILNSRNPRK